MSEPRFEISVEVSFAASHQLRGYKAEIEPLHGHNFRVQAFVVREDLEEIGYVMDFLELEEKLQRVVAPYDHRHVNDIPPFDRLNPTTENMARFFFDELRKKVPEGTRVRRVRVFEAPTFNATYGFE